LWGTRSPGKAGRFVSLTPTGGAASAWQSRRCIQVLPNRGNPGHEQSISGRTRRRAVVANSGGTWTQAPVARARRGCHRRGVSARQACAAARPNGLARSARSGAAAGGTARRCQPPQCDAGLGSVGDPLRSGSGRRRAAWSTGARPPGGTFYFHLRGAAQHGRTEPRA
jgi:hypothetical protein